MQISVAFVSVILVVLIMASFFITRIVEDYLVTQRVNEQYQEVDSLAVELTPYFVSGNTQQLYKSALESSRQWEGRVLVLDTNSVVQVDSSGKLEGLRIYHTEIQDVLDGSKGSSNGLHKLKSQQTSADGETVESTSQWVVYYTSSLLQDGQCVGVVMVSVPIQSVKDLVHSISVQMYLVFIVAIIATFLACIVVSRFISKPIEKLSQGISRMARGDYAQKVEVIGHSEISRLAEQFNEMSQKLDNLERGRNEFVSDVSHELRTPLSSMKILIESLLYDEQAGVAVYKDFLGDVNSEIDRLNNLISDLLLLVSTDQNAFSALTTAVLPVDDLMLDIIKRLEPLANKRDISLVGQVNSGLEVVGDSIKLQVALSNIVDNAIKYSQEGGRVVVSTYAEDVFAVVEVKDNGIGIPEEDLHHITERFYRVDKTRSRASGGTGLGLAIVQRIVAMHHGTMRFDSVEGEGTTVRIYLPQRTVVSAQLDAQEMQAMEAPKTEGIVDKAESIPPSKEEQENENNEK